jgi:hypothetical protein
MSRVIFVTEFICCVAPGIKVNPSNNDTE